jgi:hypothetical protein
MIPAMEIKPADRIVRSWTKFWVRQVSRRTRETAV